MVWDIFSGEEVSSTQGTPAGTRGPRAHPQGFIAFPSSFYLESLTLSFENILSSPTPHSLLHTAGGWLFWPRSGFQVQAEDRAGHDRQPAALVRGYPVESPNPLGHRPSPDWSGHRPPPASHLQLPPFPSQGDGQVHRAGRRIRRSDADRHRLPGRQASGV